MSTQTITVLELTSYIENNLENDITSQSLSEEFNMSVFQLHRIFNHLSLMPLMKYIRKRRLARGLFLLKETSLKIIDIAMQLGYKYEQSFIRAFKEEFNLTPLQYRKSEIILEVTPSIKTMDYIK